jgi:23S rRNA (uracil1939-C5)-methyltransferase
MTQPNASTTAPTTAAAPNPQTAQNHIVTITALDGRGRGVARLNIPDDSATSTGKIVFVPNTLPDETVTITLHRDHKTWAEGRLVAIEQPSPLRLTPLCQHLLAPHEMLRCGGCTLQHLPAARQREVKQTGLLDALQRIGKIQSPIHTFDPLEGASWGYRQRGSWAVAHTEGRTTIGFHAASSHHVIATTDCLTLAQPLAQLVTPLTALLNQLNDRLHVLSIDFAISQDDTTLNSSQMMPLIGLALHMKSVPSRQTGELLREFALQHHVQWWLVLHNKKGAGATQPYLSIHHDRSLHYYHPHYSITLPFSPTDFMQVNDTMNQQLVHHAITQLQPQPDEHIADLFCGLGNFTLPLATQCRKATGIEGDTTLVQRANANAVLNQLTERTEFMHDNLFNMTPARWQKLPVFDKLLLDPPRDGACAVVTAISHSPSIHQPKRIVYVSCDPATLARDAGILVHQGGYELHYAGIINLFPHTAHIESIAVFIRE